MLRQDSPQNIDPEQHKHSTPPEGVSSGSGNNIDIQHELNRLEEMILASPRIPLTRRTLVDEERLLDQLDLVRLHLPIVFQEAQALVKQKKEIILQAEQTAEAIVQSAKTRAAQILQEMNIVQQAEQEAHQIRQQTQQECIDAQEQTITEIEQMRTQAEHQLEEMRRKAIAEAKEIQEGADIYADRVLQNIEQQLSDMLRIVHNGRRQLETESEQNCNLPPEPKKS